MALLFKRPDPSCARVCMHPAQCCGDDWLVTTLEVSRSSLGHINRHTRRALARQPINHSPFHFTCCCIAHSQHIPHLNLTHTLTHHASMITEPSKRDQIDKRVPPEIWERIFGRLYPSQLTRLSRVNKNFNKIISSMSVWSYMFSRAFGTGVRLRTLSNMPESKSYMLYMCASSLYICEKCLNYTPVESLYAGTRGYRCSDRLPKRSLAPMPTLNKDNLIYMGQQVNLDWYIWMCPACRKAVRSTGEVGDDSKTIDRIRWYREQP